MNNNYFANIIIDLVNDNIDKPFLYKIPTDLKNDIKIGDKVVIPFGKTNKQNEGFVIDIFREDDIFELIKNTNDTYLKNIQFDDLKYIIEKANKKISIDSVLIDMAIFMSKEYMCPLSLCLKTVLPVKKEYRNHKNRVDVVKNYTKENKNIILNKEQNEIFDILLKFYKLNKYSNHLIYGVTGSGKTEIYIKLIEEVLKDNKKVIVLIPEISLTYQTVIRLNEKFENRIAIIHSKMTDGEKYLQIKKCKDNKIDILVGPRSAIFAPIDNLGLIIMDEEDDDSYKSDKSPRYHTRDIAIYRAKLQNAMFLSLSATPSIVSYNKSIHNIKSVDNNGIDDNEFHLYKLTKRANENIKLPQLYIVDLRKEFKFGNKSMFSNFMKQKIEEKLSNNEQIILFMNRRGLNKVVMCVNCGKIFKCPHCDISLTLHNDGMMRCHYCGYEEREPLICPDCQNDKFSHFGVGTQQLEENIIKTFPNAKVIRMDKDTTRAKNGYDTIIESFNNHKYDILVGTQMIVKGHDFKNVTLVGIMCADMTFNIQNYKSTESAFSLLTQIAGRSGRFKNGECILQTYDTDNVVIKLLKNANYEEFYKYEIQFRKKFLYPPFCNLITIYCKFKDEYTIENCLNYIKSNIEQSELYKNEKILGPIVPYPSKIKDDYYKIMYIKTKNKNTAIKIRAYINDLVKKNNKYKNISIMFDIE